MPILLLQGCKCWTTYWWTHYPIETSLCNVTHQRWEVHSTLQWGHWFIHRGRSTHRAWLVRQLLPPVLTGDSFSGPCLCRGCVAALQGGKSSNEDCTALPVISVSTWTKCGTELQRQEPVLYFIVWNVFLRVCAGKDGWQNLFTFLVLCLSVVHCIHPFHSWAERNSIEKRSVFCPPRRSTSFGNNLSENTLIFFLLLLHPAQTQDWYNFALSQHNCIKIMDTIMAVLGHWLWIFLLGADHSICLYFLVTGTDLSMLPEGPNTFSPQLLAAEGTERSLTLCYVSISRCAAVMEISIPTHFRIEK